MAYVITQNCCKDASCVPVCPVDCIRPTGGADEFGRTEMLYIDPEACIDCGACVEECPVDAIHYEDDLPESLAPFRDINAAYFARNPLGPDVCAPSEEHEPVVPGSLRVAIVGAGPAACYAATQLLAIDGVEVDLFERLPTPFGLIRAGVAPDHQHTKSVTTIFERTFAHERIGCHLNVEVGTNLTHDELMAHHHAVIYAVGASTSRDLGIPGEDLPGSHGAADFVGWYNGHPDHANHDFDLSAERAVIVGNGNVALDVARMMVMDPAQLVDTDICDHALDALSHSNIREVLILGRRGPREAAFSVSEFLALGYLKGVDIVIEGGDDLDGRPDDDMETTWKLKIAHKYVQRPTTPGNKRIVFCFLTSPIEVLGNERVEAVRVTRGPGADREDIETFLFLRSIGYCSAPVARLALDPTSGAVRNDGGRVLDAQGNSVPGVYVTGWTKRGPHGVIGTNRMCADETVTRLLADYDAGTLKRDIADREALLALMADRGIAPVDWNGWRTIDAAERARGKKISRPRVKFISVDEMLAAIKS
ncbi:FAD-dependent oxidoreductase [Mycobacterium sp. E2479]|uniref:FAD-dependent oxidoreductase n=1 Tax=Mycobacterium sp. E2479 TaxID=1834134 RepID=UPI0007FDA45B|nr:FAD-dependent oxidoreductase [Mycobacterium sp. E2479]OBH49300.1 ferredoxin [Mycobacterium sp. E2479]